MSAERPVEDDAGALELAHITKRFGPTTALDDVSLRVRGGTVHALLGENGAGKSTLMHVAFGLLRADEGRIAVTGQPRRFDAPSDAIACGIGMVHQHFTNVPAMSVAENVALGHRGAFSIRRAADRVRDIGERTGLRLDPLALAGDLPVGAQQRLEFLKALGRDARILILDEPTAVLAPSEADELLRWLRGFAAAGNSVVLITHKLAEALSVADDITVLRRGRVVASGASEAFDIGTLAGAMFGEQREQDRNVAIGAATTGSVIANVRDVGMVDPEGRRHLEGITLTVRAGEIVGVAAVEGAGQRELLRVLAGRIRPSAGTTAIPEAIAFIPENRHADALVLQMNQSENVALRGAGVKRGRIRWARERHASADLAQAFDVRGSSPNAPVRALSGGNQQKLVMARELQGAPSLVIAENPTRGLDMRATADVHARLRAAASAGAGVVVYSSDVDEVLALATRVVVMHDGRMTEATFDRDAVGRAMLGVA